MGLKRVFIFFIFVLFVSSIAYSQLADKQYAQNYGTGIVIASNKGIPARDKFDKSFVEFKNGTSFVKGGPNTTICLRAFSKDGKPFGYYLDALRKKYKPESIVENSERLVMQVWTSHSERGKNELKSNSVWPKKLGDKPNWTDFGLQVWGVQTLMDQNNNGYDWEDLNSSKRPAHFQGGSFAKWLANAKPGYKIYIAFYISLVENHEWDTYNQRWNTMLCNGEPFAAGTIEIK
jgi:hypothetical protein